MEALIAYCASIATTCHHLVGKDLWVAGSHRKSFGMVLSKHLQYVSLVVTPQLRNWRGSKAGGSAPSCSLWFNTGDLTSTCNPGFERQWNCWKSCGICRTHIGLLPYPTLWLPQPYLFGGLKICQLWNCVRRNHSWILHPLASWWLPCITRLPLEITALAIELWWSWSKLQESLLIGQTFCTWTHKNENYDSDWHSFVLIPLIQNAGEPLQRALEAGVTKVASWSWVECFRSN